MSLPWWKKILFTILLILGAIFFVLIFPRMVLVTGQRAHIISEEALTPQPVAIVFGAGLQRDGRASAVLRDRVYTAAQLYFAGKASILLLSGDNSSEFYDEPSAMRDYAIALGVPADAIVLDFAGRRTYDTCYRARHIFGVEQAVLVTQAYHQPRALFTCNALGVSSVGVPARESRYWEGAMTFWNIREYPAASAAMWDVFIARPLPVLGEVQPIQLEAQ